MAEFQEVIRQWNRMCKSIGVHNRRKCLLVHTFDISNCESCFDYALEDPAKTEEIVMAWAAEHPAVYPTWSEWLVQMGVFPQMMSTNPIKALDAICNGVCKPIPADIAQKLGIEPKEGV